MFQQFKNKVESGSKAVFWLSVATLVYQTCVHGIQPKEKASLPTAVEKQISDLQYPDYPKEVLNRIKGIPTKPNLNRADSAMSREWGLASIGFFDAFTQFSPVLKKPNF